MSKTPKWKKTMNGIQRVEYNIQVAYRAILKLKTQKGAVNEKWRKAMLRHFIGEAKFYKLKWYAAVGVKYDIRKPTYFDLIGYGQENSIFNFIKEGN